METAWVDIWKLATARFIRIVSQISKVSSSSAYLCRMISELCMQYAFMYWICAWCEWLRLDIDHSLCHLVNFESLIVAYALTEALNPFHSCFSIFFFFCCFVVRIRIIITITTIIKMLKISSLIEWRMRNKEWCKCKRLQTQMS